MKNSIITIILIIATACHNGPNPEDLYEVDTGPQMPADYCSGDELIAYTGEVFVSDGHYKLIREHTQCPYGCIEDSETAYCLSPCVDVQCGEPEVEKACETDNFLVEYKNQCVEKFEYPHYECETVVATRRLCGCYTDPEPHCYGEL